MWEKTEMCSIRHLFPLQKCWRKQKCAQFAFFSLQKCGRKQKCAQFVFFPPTKMWEKTEVCSIRHLSPSKNVGENRNVLNSSSFPLQKCGRKQKCAQFVFLPSQKM